MFYEVDVLVSCSRSEEWERWMRGTHIPDVMRTGCFERAWMLRRKDCDTETRVGYRVMYMAPDEAALERYRGEHGAFLQQEHLELFAGDVEATRAVYPTIEEFSADAEVGSAS